MTPVQPLRDTLIEAGIALLDEGGMPALTLRRAAARAGVSHAAPAHHFAGLPGLLTAMAGRAFDLFVQAMQAKIAAAPEAPRDRLLATCQGYLDFATNHAGLFHVMFVSPEVDRGAAEVMPQAALAYQLLRQACLPFAPDGAPDAGLELAVWSMVHGYAVLRLGHAPSAGGPVAGPVPFATCLDLLLAGRVAGPLAPPGQMR
jgi:AcrR family transcriptional regulator